MTVSQTDRETLRTLAARYMSYALSDKNNEKRELWRALNHLHMQKPMITSDQKPVIIMHANSLAVSSSSANLENALEFIRFMYRDDVQLEFMSKYSYLSALKEIQYENAEMTPVARETLDYLYSGEADIVNYHVNWSSLINNTFKTVINDVSAGTMTVDEACKRLYNDAKR